MNTLFQTPLWVRLLTLAVVTVGHPALAGQLVRTQAEYMEASENLAPGDTIVLANGEWRDFEIVFSGSGRQDQPITLIAQSKGKVLLTGRSNLRLAGEHLVVSGLVFKDGHTPTNAVISFRRNSKELAHHSRVTEVVIDHFNNPERFETDFWVLMYGKNNRFDHNYLVGKSNAGGDSFYIPPNASHGAVCTEPGVLLDVFSPAREDFLETEED